LAIKLSGAARPTPQFPQPSNVPQPDASLIIGGLERFVQRGFLPSAPVAATIVVKDFAFRIGRFFVFSDPPKSFQANEHSMGWPSFRGSLDRPRLQCSIGTWLGHGQQYLLDSPSQPPHVRFGGLIAVATNL
jgi:hypothetical protein